MSIGNESAFPRLRGPTPVGCKKEHGLTKLEHFAGLALSGLLANPELLKNHKDLDIHHAALVNAKALIAELEKEKK